MDEGRDEPFFAGSGTSASSWRMREVLWMGWSLEADWRSQLPIVTGVGPNLGRSQIQKRSRTRNRSRVGVVTGEPGGGAIRGAVPGL